MKLIYRPGKKSNGRVGNWAYRAASARGGCTGRVRIPARAVGIASLDVHSVSMQLSEYNEDENGYLPSIFYALLLDDHARRGFRHQT